MHRTFKIQNKYYSLFLFIPLLFILNILFNLKRQENPFFFKLLFIFYWELSRTNLIQGDRILFDLSRFSFRLYIIYYIILYDSVMIACSERISIYFSFLEINFYYYVILILLNVINVFIIIIKFIKSCLSFDNSFFILSIFHFLQAQNVNFQTLLITLNCKLLEEHDYGICCSIYLK